MAKLSIKELVALSVDKLADALESEQYTAQELAQALELEQGKEQPRKTALEALEDALEDAPSASVGVYVAEGKAITSRAGVLTGGREVLAKYFAGGQETIDSLIKRGHCVRVD